MVDPRQKKLLTEIMEADAKDGLYNNYKLTAVEWLAEQLKEYDYEDFDSDYFEFKIPIWVFAEKVKEAKAMEKEQIINAHGDEQSHLQDDGSWKRISAEQYYNKTFKK